MDEDEPPRASDEEQKDEAGGWMEVQDSGKDENLSMRIRSRQFLMKPYMRLLLGKDYLVL